MVPLETLTFNVRGAIFEVHHRLRTGLLETAYRKALLHELHLRGIPAQEEVKVPIVYKDMRIDDAYRLDILVDNRIILELKSVEELHPIHFKQIVNYLNLTRLRLGYLINFNSVDLKDHEDLNRIINFNASETATFPS